MGAAVGRGSARSAQHAERALLHAEDARRADGKRMSFRSACSVARRCASGVSFTCLTMRRSCWMCSSCFSSSSRCGPGVRAKRLGRRIPGPPSPSPAAASGLLLTSSYHSRDRVAWCYPGGAQSGSRLAQSETLSVDGPQ